MLTVALSHTVRFLNDPTVKEGIKNVASIGTFSFGIFAAYDAYQITRGRNISTEGGEGWAQTANKVAILCAKIALLLSAATSRVGVWIFSKMGAGSERIFGPSGIYAVNPLHPRHVLSIVAVLFALPAVGQSLYRGMRNICQHSAASQTENPQAWLTDTKVRLMTLFNTITSRPVLHLGNQLCHSILSI